MQLFSKLIATSILALSVTSAQAAFISTDWHQDGDKLATLDDSTGIEWLSLSQTRGMSIAHVQTLLDSDYAGWRLPTREEVSTLMSNLTNGLITADDGSAQYRTTQYHAEALNIQEKLGYSGRSSNGLYWYSRGLYLNDTPAAGESTVLFSGADYYNQANYSYIYDDISRSNDITYSYTGESVFLVSDGGTTLSSINDPTINTNNPDAPINQGVSDVPVTFALGGLLMLGLGLRRSR